MNVRVRARSAAQTQTLLPSQLKIEYLAPGDIKPASRQVRQHNKDKLPKLKAMAAEFPSLTPAASALGITGVNGVAKLSAALQIARKGAGDSSSAATNTANLMQKIVSPLATKKFAKAGIDIRKELKKTQKTGGDVFEMIARVVKKATNGDMSKLGDFFEDAQVQQFIRPLIANLDDYVRIRDKAAGASGVVDRDFERRLLTGDAALAQFKSRMEDLGCVIGSILLPGVNNLLAVIGDWASKLAAVAEAHPALTQAIITLTSALIAVRVAAIVASFANLQFRAALLNVATAATWMGAQLMGVAGAALMPFRSVPRLSFGVNDALVTSSAAVPSRLPEQASSP